MEERRLLLAVALSLLVLTGYRLLFPPAPVPPASAQRPAVSALPPAEPRPEPSPTAPSRPESGATNQPAIADDRERRVEAQGPDLVVAFTNRGARLLSWTLTAFKDSRGRPEEMVQTPPGGPRALDIETGDPDLDARLRDALFKAATENVNLTPSGGSLRFEYAEADLVVTKEIRLQPRGFLAEVQVSVRQAGRELPKKLLWGPGIGNPSAAEMEVRGYQAPQGVAFGVAGVERHPADQLAAAALALPTVGWLGVDAHYFAALLVPPGGRGAGELRGVKLPPGEDGQARNGPQAALDLGAGSGSALVYVGPKDHQVLSQLGHGLAQIVPVGEWIGPIVVVMMRLLRFVHSHVGGYGWSVVVLTVLINLAMSPLRHYSIANGVKMAKLSPEMKVIQERYRKLPALDPKRQEMQREVAALYARHGMSMGTQMTVGCLPILLTMPFLFAFYRVLEVSVELKGAPFLWISDLSQKDPLFLTPLLMGASMFVMQRMTPSTMDPAQQRVMLLMPLMFGGMFLWAPAGLNLYWLTSNLCSILQQGVTLRMINASENGPRKERRRK